MTRDALMQALKEQDIGTGCISVQRIRTNITVSIIRIYRCLPLSGTASVFVPFRCFPT